MTHFKRRKVVTGKTPIKNNKVVILSNVTWGSSSKISSALNEIVSEEAIVGFNFSSQGGPAHCRIQLATIEAALKVYEHFHNHEYDGKKVQAAYETIDPAKLPQLDVSPNTGRMQRSSPPSLPHHTNAVPVIHPDNTG